MEGTLLLKAHSCRDADYTYFLDLCLANSSPGSTPSPARTGRYPAVVASIPPPTSFPFTTAPAF